MPDSRRFIPRDDEAADLGYKIASRVAWSACSLSTSLLTTAKQFGGSVVFFGTRSPMTKLIFFWSFVVRSQSVL